MRRGWFEGEADDGEQRADEGAEPACGPHPAGGASLVTGEQLRGPAKLGEADAVDGEREEGLGLGGDDASEREDDQAGDGADPGDGLVAGRARLGAPQKRPFCIRDMQTSM